MTDEHCRWCRRPIDRRQATIADRQCVDCWTGPAVDVPSDVRSLLVEQEQRRKEQTIAGWRRPAQPTEQLP